MIENIKEAIAEKFKFPLEKIKTDTLLAEIVEDSISKIEFLFEIEKNLGKRIPEEDILDMETIGDLLHAINKIK